MSKIKRNKKNSLERKCLSKNFKRLFKNCDKKTFKILEKVKNN